MITTAGSTKERLTQAALEVFLEQGYVSARVQDIAKRAGLTTGAIYANYSGKGELLAEAMKLAATTSYDRLGEDPSRASMTLDDFQEHLVDATLGDALPVHQLILEGWVAALHDKAAADGLIPDIRLAEDDVRTRLAEIEAAGTLRSDVDPHALQVLYRNLVMGGIAAKVLGLEAPDRAALSDLVRRMVAALTT